MGHVRMSGVRTANRVYAQTGEGEDISPCATTAISCDIQPTPARKSSIAVLSPRPLFKSGRLEITSNGFLFSVTYVAKVRFKQIASRISRRTALFEPRRRSAARWLQSKSARAVSAQAASTSSTVASDSASARSTRCCNVSKRSNNRLVRCHVHRVGHCTALTVKQDWLSENTEGESVRVSMSTTQTFPELADEKLLILDLRGVEIENTFVPRETDLWTTINYNGGRVFGCVSAQPTNELSMYMCPSHYLPRRDEFSICLPSLCLLP